MSVVFITGMSGTGKSTALRELDRRGFETVDTDYGAWCHDVDGDQVWDEGRISELLARTRHGVLYISGTVSNQGRFYKDFSAVVLLTAPHQVLFQRLETRTTNNYGKSAAERDDIAAYLAAVEPLLRATCTHEISTNCSVEEVVAELIQIGIGS